MYFDLYFAAVTIIYSVVCILVVPFTKTRPNLREEVLSLMIALNICAYDKRPSHNAYQYVQAKL